MADRSNPVRPRCGPSPCPSRCVAARARGAGARGSIRVATPQRMRKIRPPWNSNVSNLNIYRPTVSELERRKQVMASRNVVMGRLDIHDKGRTRKSPETMRKVHGLVFKDMVQEFEQDVDSIMKRSTQALEGSQAVLTKPAHFTSKSLGMLLPHRAMGRTQWNEYMAASGDAKGPGINKYKKGSTKSVPTYANSPRKMRPLNDSPKIMKSQIRFTDQERSGCSSDSGHELDGFHMNGLRKALDEIQAGLDCLPHKETEEERESGSISSFTSDLLITMKAMGNRYNRLKQELDSERKTRQALESKLHRQGQALVDLAHEVQKLQASQINLMKKVSTVRIGQNSSCTLSSDEESPVMPSRKDGGKPKGNLPVNRGSEQKYEEQMGLTSMKYKRDFPIFKPDSPQDIPDMKPNDASLSMASDFTEGTEYAELAEGHSDSRLRVVVDTDDGTDPSKVVILLAPPRRWKGGLTD